MTNIKAYSHEIEFNFKSKTKIFNWLEEAVAFEKCNLGLIQFIFCSNTFLLSINKKFLKHNFFTDIITFDYSEGSPKSKNKRTVSGEIYISIDQVKENANKFEVKFEEELKRVMVHGVLHLCGAKDKSQKEKKKMRQKEDFHLLNFSKENAQPKKK